MAVVKFIAVSGLGANHLELVPLANTPINVVASSESAFYPATNQINRHAIKPWLPWQADALISDLEIVFDKNQIFNGGFETGDLEGWESGGDVQVVASPVHAGNWAVQFGADETEPFALQTTNVRAGEKITVEGALEALTGGEGNITVTIEELGLYLDPDGVTWTSTPTVWFTRTTNSMLFKTSSPVVPAYNPIVPSGVYALTINLDGDDFVADSIALWHWTDTAAIIGHNVHPVLSNVQLRASTDNFGANNTLIYTWTPPSATDPVTDLTKLRWPNTWASFTMVGQRWWQFLFSGDNDQPIFTGQCILTQKLELSRNPNYGIVVETDLAQKRRESEAGAIFVFTREDIQRRVFRFPWRYHSSTEWQEARNRIFHTSKFGQWPTVLIHDNLDAESCAFVLPPQRYDYTHKFVNVRDSVDFPLRELAFPTFD